MERDRANVIKDELVEQDNHFLAVYVEAKNSVLVLLSEREDKMGTMAVAVPRPGYLIGPITSSLLLGDKFAVSARLFAEYVASRKGKTAVVSVYLEKLTELQAHAYFQKLLDRVLANEIASEATKTREAERI